MSGKFVLVGAPSYGTNSNYKGTDRTTPYYRDEFPEVHEVNQAFLWYIHNSEVAGAGILNNVEDARSIVRKYKEHAGEEFEILEAVRGAETPEYGKEFLGFDISAQLQASVLSGGLELCYRRDSAQVRTSGFAKVTQAVRVLRRRMHTLGRILNNVEPPFRYTSTHQDTVGHWDKRTQLAIEQLQPIICLMEKYFKAKLNDNGLFDDYETAQHCHNCMIAINKYIPRYFENIEETYEIVGLYRVE